MVFYCLSQSSKFKVKVQSSMFKVQSSKSKFKVQCSKSYGQQLTANSQKPISLRQHNINRQVVAVSTLVVATRESAEGIVHVRACFGEHEVFAEDVCRAEFVGAGACIHQAAGDDNVVEHFPRIAVSVGAETVTEEFPHGVVKIINREFLGFGFRSHFGDNALRGGVVVQVAHIDELCTGMSVEDGIRNMATQLSSCHSSGQASLLTTRLRRPVVHHNVKGVGIVQNARYWALSSGTP